MDSANASTNILQQRVVQHSLHFIGLLHVKLETKQCCQLLLLSYPTHILPHTTVALPIVFLRPCLVSGRPSWGCWLVICLFVCLRVSGGDQTMSVQSRGSRRRPTAGAGSAAGSIARSERTGRGRRGEKTPGGGRRTARVESVFCVPQECALKC